MASSEVHSRWVAWCARPFDLIEQRAFLLLLGQIGGQGYEFHQAVSHPSLAIGTGERLERILAVELRSWLVHPQLDRTNQRTRPFGLQFMPELKQQSPNGRNRQQVGQVV
jgi:hypothetical protein